MMLTATDFVHMCVCVCVCHVTLVSQVKALSEELENPLNVHRWRKLEGSDPSTYEMIQKIQTLQKRLIAKTEEVRAGGTRASVPCCVYTSCSCEV